MKKILALVLGTLMILVLVCACGGDSGSEASVVGAWKEVDGEGIIYFAEDGSGESAKVSYLSASFEYTAEKGVLTITSEENKKFDYAIDGAILTITADGVKYKYERMELPVEEVREKIKKKTSEDSEEPETEESGNTKEEKPEPGSPGTGDSEPEAPQSETISDEEIKASIVGAWETEYKGSRQVYIFNADGTGSATILPMTYTVENGVITITVSGFGKTETGSAEYTVGEDTLILKNGEDTHILYRTEMPKIG